MSGHHGAPTLAGGASDKHEPYSRDHEPGMHPEPHSAKREHELLMGKPRAADESVIDSDEPSIVSDELLVTRLPAKSLQLVS